MEAQLGLGKFRNAALKRIGRRPKAEGSSASISSSRSDRGRQEVHTEADFTKTSLAGRRFRAAGDVKGGEVGTETLFEYEQDGDLIQARYGGGQVRLGFLVGTRRGNKLDFRYVQLNHAGETAGGHCTSVIEVLSDGRLRLRETWVWESRTGAGISEVEEVQ